MDGKPRFPPPTGGKLKNSIKYVHTNLIAKDWRKVAQFYIDVFDCKISYPERNLSGEWLDKVTSVPNAKIKGAHLVLPGYENGPTLELFEYEPENLRSFGQAINHQGLTHIAFHADNVEQVLEKAISFGGTPAGQLVQREYPELGLLTMVYIRDPEGNIVEVQNWKKMNIAGEMEPHNQPSQ